MDTPELLQIVISNLDSHSLPIAARACKLWSELALDELWRDCRHLKNLLSLLAPMVWDANEACYRFRVTSPPSSQSWARFHSHYAPRIRTLYASTCTDSDETIPIHPSVFDTLELERVNLHQQPILPNLHTISWFTYKLPLGLSFPLLHPGIRSFTIIIPVMTTPTLSEDDWHPNVLRDLAMPSRMPHLSRLCFIADWVVSPRSPLEDILVEFWEQTLSLPCLEEIQLGSASLTSRIGSTLSRVQSLTKLEVRTVALWERDQALNRDIHCSPTTRPLTGTDDAFPKLERLELSASVSDCVKLLRYFRPRNLSHLELRPAVVYEVNQASEVTELLGLLAELYSETLEVLCCKGSSRVYNSNARGAGPTIDTLCFNFHTLKPLLRLSHLHTLSIGNNYPLSITNADVEIIVSHLPHLQILNLNSDPDNCVPITLSWTLEGAVHLSLDVLLTIAEYCPMMKWLGLLVDTTLPCPRLASSAMPFDIPALRNLHTFHIGLSNIGNSQSEMEEVEAYLRPVFPDGFRCVLWVGRVPGGCNEPWPEGEEEMWEEAVRRVRAWEGIGRRLQLAKDVD